MKEKNKKIFGIVMIVIAAIITGAFLGIWAVNLEQSYNSCFADVSEDFSESTISNINGARENFNVLRSNVNTSVPINFEFDIQSLSVSTVNGTNFVVGFSLNLGLVEYSYSNSQWNLLTYYSWFSNSSTGQIDLSFSTNLSQSVALYSNYRYNCYNVDNISQSVKYYVYGGLIYTKSSSSDIIGLGTLAYQQFGYTSVQGAPFDFSVASSIDNNMYYYYSQFVDFNGNSLTFYFATNNGVNPLYGYNRFYFGNSNQNSVDYNNGYNAGLESGQNSGYNEGYNNGFNIGKQTGISLGIQQANSYSFTSLLGAVIDVPVNAFTSVFNFELLGVNMKDFLAGLLTICVVIVVIRFVLVK